MTKTHTHPKKKTGRRINARQLAAVSMREIEDVIQAVRTIELALDGIGASAAKLSVAIDLLKMNAAELARLAKKPPEGKQ